MYIVNIICAIIYSYIGSKIYLLHGNNIFLSILYGLITVTGGGTIRDLILRRKIFWIKTPIYILISIITSVITTILNK